jgi:hypothetical protein
LPTPPFAAHGKNYPFCDAPRGRASRCFLAYCC